MMRGTFFASLFSRDGRRFEASWSRFFARFAQAKEFATKEAAPRWSAATFAGDRRALANVESVSAVVLDVDTGASAAAIDNAFGELFGLAHTTWSATESSPRWRIILPLDRPATLDEFDRVWRATAMHIESRGIRPDYAARDASRIWSVPAIPHGGAYRCIQLFGGFFSVDDALSRIPAPEPLPDPSAFSERRCDLATRIERARRYVEAMDPAIAGQGGHRATFRVALALVRGFGLPEDEALQIMIADYNPRCAPPWSISDLRHKVRSAATRARTAHGWLIDGRRA